MAQADVSVMHWKEGVNSFNAGNYQRAISEFQGAAPTKGVLFNLGVTTSKANDPQTAIGHFDSVLRLDSSLGVAYLTRGVCKHTLEQYAAAVKDYDRALETMGDESVVDYAGEGLPFTLTRVDLLFNKALSLKRMGRVHEAADCVKQAKEAVDSNTKSRVASLDRLMQQLQSAGAAKSVAARPPPPAKGKDGKPAGGGGVMSKIMSLGGKGRGAQSQALEVARGRAVERGGAGVQFYSLEDLTGDPPFPDGVDPARREMYLSEEDFRSVFNMSKEDFDDMPAWKKELLKRKKGLF